MKTKSFRSVIFAFAVCLALTVGVAARADDGGDDQGDDEQGGDIQGLEHLDLVVVLTATNNAPLGATGTAKLEVEDDDGATTATLELEVVGLDPGTYTVGVATNAGSPKVVLGTFAVGSESDDSEDASDSDDGNEMDDVEFGGGEGLPLPEGLNPMAIVGVCVSDANGNVVLVGDFMNVSQITEGEFDADVDVEAGPAAPAATGIASIHAKAKHGQQKMKFSLTVQGLAAKSTYVLKLNGVAVGNVTSNGHGMLKLKKLPGHNHPRSITSIELRDSQGGVAARAKF